jgi:hypothetical protein
MRFLKKALCLPELYVAIVTLALGLVVCCGKVIAESVTLTRSETTRPALFPILEKMDRDEIFHISFDVNAGSSYNVHIVPDDCIESFLVNGEEVSLNGIKGVCDYNNGFRLEYEQFKGTGKDHFDIAIRNGVGPGGLNIGIEYGKSALWSLARRGFFIGFVLLCALLLRHLKMGTAAYVILVCGIVLRLFFVDALPAPNKFGHDVDGHIAYVQYIVGNEKIPATEDCWTCYHPPVYFAMMAPLWKFAPVLKMQSDVALQVASFVLSLLILLFGFLVLRQIFSGVPLNLATLLWTFWPMMVLSCGRIGNDQLFYLLHIVCLWGALGYLQKRNGRRLLIAAIASLLAVWTKTTGAISIGICMLALLLGYFSPVGGFRLKKGEVASIVVLALTVISCGVKMYLNGGEIVSNAHSLNGGLKVGRDFVNFLYVDVKQLLAYPYTSPWENDLGRQYFVSYMHKTSLFGEFKLLTDSVGVFWAEVVNVTSLLLGFYVLRGIWGKALDRKRLLLLVQFAVFVVALAYLRWQHPYSCSNDFRYIAPVLLSVVPFAVEGITVEKGSFKWKVCGVLSLVAFAVSSAVLMVLLALAIR